MTAKQSYKLRAIPGAIDQVLRWFAEGKRSRRVAQLVRQTYTIKYSHVAALGFARSHTPDIEALREQMAKDAQRRAQKNASKQRTRSTKVSDTGSCDDPVCTCRCHQTEQHESPYAA